MKTLACRVCNIVTVGAGVTETHQVGEHSGRARTHGLLRSEKGTEFNIAMDLFIYFCFSFSLGEIKIYCVLFICYYAISNCNLSR